MRGLSSFLILGSQLLCSVSLVEARPNAWSSPRYKPGLLPRQSSTSSNGTFNATAPVIFPLSTDSYFSFYFTEVLSLANGGGTATSEVLRAISQITPGSFESVYEEFKFLADAIHAVATSVDAKKHPISAQSAYFRAASYYRAADFFLHGNVSDPRIYTLWDSALADFNAAASLLPVPGEYVNVSAVAEDGTNFTVPIRFYKASNGDCKTPTVLVGGGYDSSQEESFHQFGRETLARGWNFATYEGPGQPTVRRQQQIGFIPDWWNVVTPAVSYLTSRPDVDSSRIALMGISFGGTLAPLAASREQRLAAVLSVDGLLNMTDAIVAQLPSEIVEPFIAGNVTQFNTIIDAAAASHAETELTWLVDQSKWSFDTTSAFDWLTRLKNISLTADIIDTIEAPVFDGQGEDDTLTNPQALTFRDEFLAAGKNVTYNLFKTNLGAGEHCQLGAEPQLAQVAFDWLDGVFKSISA